MFQDSDFEVFEDKTLEGRMNKIKSIIDPKFEKFAEIAIPILHTNGQDWYAHIAKHLRRTTNAPDNTWVAFAPNKRGYKMLPHFELGIWQDNVYLYLAVEENMKPIHTSEIMPKLLDVSELVHKLPKEYCLSQDHMVNTTIDLSKYAETVARYEKIKHSEVLIGLEVKRGDKRFGSSELTDVLVDALKQLLPIYEKLK